jgi:WD40 repeat protein
MWVGELPAKASVYVLAFSPDNRTLYSGDGQGYALAWDLAARTYRTLHRLPYRPGGQPLARLLLGADGSLLIQDGHRLIDALRPDAGAVLDPGPGELGWFLCLSPDGRRAGKTDPDRNYGVDWWDLEAGLRLPMPEPLGSAQNVSWQALLPDGRGLATYGWGWQNHRFRYELALWDLHTGERLARAAVPEKASTYGFESPRLSPDGRTVAVARGSTVHLYDVPSRSFGRPIEVKRQVGAMAFHPNGRLAALVGSRKQVELWDLVDGRRLERFDWKCGTVLDLAFAPDGQTCAAGGFGKVVVWDVDA